MANTKSENIHQIANVYLKYNDYFHHLKMNAASP